MVLFGPKLSIFISKTFEFLFKKKRCSLKIAVPEFQIYKKNFSEIFENKHEHELFHMYSLRILLTFQEHLFI